MKASKSNLRKIFKDKQFVIDLAVCSALIIVSLVLLGILVGTHVNEVHWNWITGFILGALFSTLALLLIRLSVKALASSENYYFYVFLFICRIGLYFIPFLLGYFIRDWGIFSVYGILWGFVPLVAIPLSGVVPALVDVFPRKDKKLLSQAR